MTRVAPIGFLCVALLTLPLAAQPERRRAPEPPPHLVMERLTRMSPEERSRMFNNVPPKRRALIEQRLSKYNELPEAAKERLREEYDQFQQLSPDKQDEVRKLFRQFSELPDERRKVMRKELQRLRRMKHGRALARLNAESFRVEFSEPEREMLQSLLVLLAKEPSSPTAAAK